MAVVSISGGKDSTATALLALERYGPANCRFVFADTGNEHEMTLAYVHEYLPRFFGPIDTVRADFSREIASKRRYVADVWPQKGVPQSDVERVLSVLQPTGNPFLDLCLWKGRFSSRMAQFCTQFLKRLPLDQYLLDQMATTSFVESWRGVRRDESARRRRTPSRERTAEGYDVVYAIADWSAQRTVDFIRSRSIELNPLYRLGSMRVGCMPCINVCKDELLEISKRFPQHIDRIREWEHVVSLASKRGLTSFFADSIQDDETDLQVFERLRIDERVRWAGTSHGGRQLDMLRLDAPALCSSAYGLCE